MHHWRVAFARDGCVFDHCTGPGCAFDRSFERDFEREHANQGLSLIHISDAVTTVPLRMIVSKRITASRLGRSERRKPTIFVVEWIVAGFGGWMNEIATREYCE